MEFSQFKAILAIQELASLTEAGKRLHLSPSAVFCQIRQLEEEFGQKLYERVGKRLRLTEFGQRFVKHAQGIMQAHDGMLESLQSPIASRRPILRIGCGPHASVRIMPHLLRAFLAVQRNTDIRVTTDDDVLRQEIRLGALDAALYALPVEDAELVAEPLWSFERVLVLPPDGAGLGTKVALADLRNYPFILYRRPAVSETTFMDLCRQLDFRPDIVMENDEADSIKELVKLGIGATFLPYWSVGDEVRMKTLRVLRVPLPRYNYGLIYRRYGFRPQAIKVLREVAHRWQKWWPLAPYVKPPVP